MASLWSDLQFAARKLKTRPALTAVAVSSLALGIGANTAIFSIIESALLRGLPLRDADRLVYLRDRQPCCETASLSPGEYLDYSNETKTLSGLAAAVRQHLTLTGRFEPQKIEALAVTPNYFDVLGAAPLLGRLISSSIDRRDADSRVAVLSYATWGLLFGADPRVVGRDILLDGHSFRVVGILKEKQAYPSDVQVWVSPRFAVPEYEEVSGAPVALARNIVETYGDHWLWAVGRLRPGTSLGRARAELEAIASRTAAHHPNTKDHHPALFFLQESIVGSVRPALWVLLTAVVVLLLIACANLAGLLLARSVARSRELAVRVSLGASRWEITRLLLSESLLLAFLGGAAGILVEQFSLSLLTKYSPYDLPGGMSPELNLNVLLFCLAVTLIAGLLSGIVPALRSTRTDLAEGLKDSAKGSAGSEGTRLRQALVAAEIALSVTLLIAASLLLRSFLSLINTDTGFNSQRVISARLSLPQTKYPDSANVSQFWHTFLERTSSLPDVAAVGLVSDIPLSGSNSGSYVKIEGHPVFNDAGGMYVNEFSVSPGTFRALGIPLIAGRVFNDADTGASLKVAVINKQFADKAFPHQNPLGKRFRGAPVEGWFTVIGVVGNIRHDGLNENPTPDMFFNYTQWNRPSNAIEICTRNTAVSAGSELRTIVRMMDRDLPLTAIKPLGDYIGESIAGTRFLLGLVSVFSGLAILLAAIGLYAVLTFSIQQRKREIGIRIAVGAQQIDVVRIVIGECATIAAVGLFAGLLGGLWSSSLLESLLFGIKHTDLTAYGTAFVLILAAVAFAAILPAIRAVRTDPILALRYE